MEVTVHVGEGEGGEILGGVFVLKVECLVAWLWLHLVELLGSHLFLHSDLNLLEVLETRLVASLLLYFFNHGAERGLS